MPFDKYFYLVSELNGFVLDVKGADGSGGTKVITYPRKEGKFNQLWWEDNSTGTIRSKLNDYCLDLDASNTLVINPIESRVGNQGWTIDKISTNPTERKIASISDPNRVLEVAGSDDDSGARICAWRYNGGINQIWRVDYDNPKDYFWIKSHMNGKVLDVYKESKSEGAKVVMYQQKSGCPENQLWFKDQRGNIRSKLNGFLLDGSGDNLCMRSGSPYENRKFWVFEADYIVNYYNKSEVLDIAGRSDKDGAEIIPFKQHGGSNQRWTVVYA